MSHILLVGGSLVGTVERVDQPHVLCLVVELLVDGLVVEPLVDGLVVQPPVVDLVDVVGFT